MAPSISPLAHGILQSCSFQVYARSYPPSWGSVGERYGSWLYSLLDKQSAHWNRIFCLDVLPKDELLKILMTNSNLTMPIEKQKAAVQVVLETLQQVQPPKSAFPKLLECKYSISALEHGESIASDVNHWEQLSEREQVSRTYSAGKCYPES